MRTQQLAVALALALGSFVLSIPAQAVTHDQICQANRDQCISGCGGMAQCTNACWDNYYRCKQAGQ
ncbi:hypothetical protein [Acidiferrobacter sp.]|jgi:hypothetical protein|uniref:hypothetical protein n=1 Tax=Acidiferrobacter sp. TaxID=1872107 RepID=UPI002639DC14|nr:hypothetical protein [Acidiferrobacter sp.]